MKKLLLLFLFLSNIAFGQNRVNYTEFNSAVNNPEIINLQGNWGIDHLITGTDKKEYNLSLRKSNDRFFYGNSISIKPDGTFVCSYSAPCGNDCFTTSTGKYKMLDENYISFYLEKISKHGDCQGSSEPNVDLGLFRIYKENGNFKLRISDGNSENDKKNLEYIAVLDQKYQEISGLFGIKQCINWFETKSLYRIEDIASFCMEQNKIKDYEILYSKGFQDTYLILVKIKNKYHYILFESDYANRKKAALFDNDFFEKADNLVSKIDGDKSLKKDTMEEARDYSRNPLSKNILVVYKKNGEIQKIIHHIYNREDKYYKETFYLSNNVPSIIKIEAPEKENFAFYVCDFENMDGAVMKPLSMNWSFSGIRQQYYQFMEDIKKAGLK
ncbi:hypothetical protein [Flavobacterium sp. UBA7680]|uniref:hypothetical protein n=1 Tax=Flavobacterium sp. UBA7680 TaxID=1946559 RepID=UPI0025B934ED|nr:hypothetical protein [Flavobacterium sp. UBA7680]